MKEVAAAVVAGRLRSGQRVLALTFMHGSRRRLDSRLRAVPGLSLNFDCVTIDSFAQRIVRRWATLAKSWGAELPGDREFTAMCDLAGRLLEHEATVKWVAAGFPIVVVDEAQDVTPERLRMIRALSTRLDVLAAADEFQCLNEDLRPNPFMEWLAETSRAEGLTTSWRTSVPGLVGAAAALRAGRELSAAPPSFKIDETPSVALAATYVTNASAWNPRPGETIAIITPSIQGFSDEVVARVGKVASKQGHGPYRVVWERTESDVVAGLLTALDMTATAEIGAAEHAIKELQDRHAVNYVSRWLRTQRRAAGRTTVDRQEVEAVIERGAAQRRRVAHGEGSWLTAMTIHSAKNREFDGVIILWPYKTGGSSDQKRRLLYTAVTRAKRWCQILVQGKGLRAQPPFVADTT